MQIVVNPGTEPIKMAFEDDAISNMKHFIADISITGIQFVRISDNDYGDGWFAFLIWKDNKCHEIQMPGLPLNKVRFIRNKNMNPWNFPRLYIDGSSWLWDFAVGIAFRDDDEY